MEKELDLLIATEMSGDGDSVAEELRSVFAKRGVTVHRIEFRSGKDSVIRSVRANPQIHAVVLSQYQDQEKLSPRDIDQICSTAEGDLQVFVVVSEMRGSDYMKEIESLGIYTAVYQEDASFEKIAEWYCNGRTKKEARAYYGVAGGDHVVQYRNMDVNASIQYLLEYDGSYTDLIQRMSVLVNGIPASQVASIVCQLPDPICEMLKREPRFALICQMAEEQYAYLYKPSGQPEKADAGEKADTAGEEQPKNKAIRRFLRRKQEKETECKPAKRQACEIGVMATNIGVGCTTISILLANTLAHEGKRAAIVELDDADGCFEQLCRQEREEEQVDGITKFAIGTLDYYYHVPLQKFQLDYKPLYDFIVYDFGCLDQETIFHVYARMQNRFIVTSKAEWKQHELKELLKDIKGMPGEDECRVLISSHCVGSDFGDVKELLPENTVLAAIPYESNPFYPGKACRQIFLKLLDGTYKEEKYKRSDSVEQRFSERPRDFKKFGIQIVMGALLVACMGFMVSACSANNRYNRMVTKADTFITGLEEENRQAEDELQKKEKELKALEHEVYYAQTDIPAGQLISGDMVQKEIVQTEFDDSFFINASDLGSVAASIPIKAGTPLMKAFTGQVFQDPQDGDNDLPDLADREDIGMEELVIAVLKKIGCQPETNEEGHIVFKYQGDDFYIAVEDEARFIMIWNPWWASISMDNPALPYLKEIVNLVNVDSLVTTVFTADEDEKNVGLHSKCHTVFTPKEGQLDEYLKAMLDHFFVTHDAIKQNLQQLGSAASESVNKERTKVKGFAAYKENSTPLSSVEEEKK